MEAQTEVGKLVVQRRDKSGKGHARKLRATGKIPAVCYGPDAETIHLALDPEALKKALDPGRRGNTVIELTVEGAPAGEQLTVMLKDYHMDPIRQTLVHADFVRVKLDQEVHVSVPLILAGRPEGVKLGGTLHQVFRDLPVTCTPGKIPAEFSVDVSHLQLNDLVQIKDLDIPDGVTVELPETQTIGLVMAPRAATAEEEGEEGEGEGEEGAEGEGERKDADDEGDKG